jgi:type IV secretory pathway component VirB8
MFPQFNTCRVCKLRPTLTQTCAICDERRYWAELNRREWLFWLAAVAFAVGAVAAGLFAAFLVRISRPGA